MTIKELAQTINPDIDLFIRFNGDELVYCNPLKKRANRYALTSSNG